MAIPANIAIGWPSTAASIPTGWTRETALDARYLLGAATGADTDLTTDRGNTSHTHTSPAHTPIQDPHDHIGYSEFTDSTVLAAGFGSTRNWTGELHYHDITYGTATPTNDAVAITVDSTSNDLAYAEVIWIKSDGTPTSIPSGAVAFYASDTLPTNWSRVYGNRYLKGATAGGNGGSTGGSNTHTHTSPAHTHTQSSHYHVGTSDTTFDTGNAGTGVDSIAARTHKHVVTLSTDTATNQSVTTTISSSSHEPPYSKINIIQSSAATLPTDIICLWLGTHTGIPSGWDRYTSLDGKWIKGSNADSEVGTTGGSATHTHTASSCQPIQDFHEHAGYSDGGPTVVNSVSSGTRVVATSGHTHIWYTDGTTATNQSAAVTIDSISSGAAYPKHRTVIFVKFSGSTTPTVSRSCYTSYEIGLFDLGGPEAQLLPEVLKKIAQGDLRFVPR